MSIAEQDRNGVQVIRRAAQILDALKDAPTGTSLSQIAARTGLARSTVHRLVGALEREQFVVPVSRMVATGSGRRSLRWQRRHRGTSSSTSIP